MADNHSEQWNQLNLFDLLQPTPTAVPSPPQIPPQILPASRKLNLRDYQGKMKRDIYQQVRAGYKRILVYGPTGCGKTLVLSSILQDAISKGRRSMLLVHRDFLVEQTIDTLINLGVAGDAIGVIKAGYKEDRTKPLQICGIQSLQRREMLEDIGMVIIDECHSCAFWTEYERVKEATTTAIHLGFSASPWRLKSSTEYFGQHFDSIVLGPSIKWLIKHGYLARPRYFGWGGYVDLSQLDTGSDGDYKVRQMEAAFINSDVPEMAVEKIQQLCEGRTGIVFNAGVQQSRIQTKLLNEAGIPTCHVDATTSVDERRQIYRQLEAGEIRCISSIGCLTEGFDVKSISFIVFARATKSRALYVQICGRGIRSFPGKHDCLILDFGKNIQRHGYLSKNWKITLEPSPPKPETEAYKECPTCGTAILAVLRVCPFCGHVFEGGDIEDYLIDFEAEFGELFDSETYEQVKYCRSQRKARFSKFQPPDKLWETFKAKFNNTILINDWLIGAIFQGSETEFNRQLLLDYLVKFAPTNKEHDRWIKFHVELEFGRPGRSYKTGKNKTKEAAIGTLKRREWWEILEVEQTADWTNIKQAYRKLAMQYHPDTSELSEEIALDKMKMLNWAFDMAKKQNLI